MFPFCVSHFIGSSMAIPYKHGEDTQMDANLLVGVLRVKIPPKSGWKHGKMYNSMSLVVYLSK